MVHGLSLERCRAGPRGHKGHVQVNEMVMQRDEGGGLTKRRGVLGSCPTNAEPPNAKPKGSGGSRWTGLAVFRGLCEVWAVAVCLGVSQGAFCPQAL